MAASLLLCGVCLGTPLEAPPPAVRDAHLWFVRADDELEGHWALCVRSPRSEDYTVVRRLPTPPWLATHGNTLWLHVADGHEDRASIHALRATWDASMGSWITDPPVGEEVLPSCEIEGPVMALVGAAQGPILMTGPVGSSIHVDQYRRGAWTRLGAVTIERGEAFIGAVDHDAGLRLLLDAAETGARVTTLEGASHELSCVDPVGIVRVGPDLMVGCMHQGVFEASWVLEDSQAVLARATLDQPGAWMLVGGAATAGLVAPGGPEVRIREIRPGASAIAPAVTLTRTSQFGTRLWSVFISAGIGVAFILVLLLSRTAAPVIMPGGWVVAPLGRRTGALILDLIPGVAAAVMVLETGAAQLMRAPLFGPTPATLASLVWMTSVTVLWCAIWEMLTGRTPGKRLCGLVVIDSLGRRPGVWRVVVRNIFKGFVLLAPPLAMLVLIMPLGQGLGDVIGRTLVVRPGPPPPA